MILLPLCVVFIISPEPYLAILFTEEYTVAALAVTILALGYLLSSSVGPENMVITGLGYSKYTLLNTALMLGVNITLNVALVPRFGIIGAAVGTSVALTVRSIVGVTEIYFLESIHPYSFAYTRIWTAGSVSIAAGVLVSILSLPQHIEFFIIPSIVFSTYILGLIFFDAFTEDDHMVASRLDSKIGYPIFQRIISLS
jgi:O-antigen/teichoic acid export membrane protein